MNVDRRTFLLGAASTVLAGCADGKDDPRLNTATRALERRSVAIDYASYYAPYADVQRHATARAEELGALPTFSNDAAGVAAQVAQLKLWTGERGGLHRHRRRGVRRSGDRPDRRRRHQERHRHR